jgi:hypothetical protein
MGQCRLIVLEGCMRGFPVDSQAARGIMNRSFDREVRQRQLGGKAERAGRGNVFTNCWSSVPAPRLKARRQSNIAGIAATGPGGRPNQLAACPA